MLNMSQDTNELNCRPTIAYFYLLYHEIIIYINYFLIALYTLLALQWFVVATVLTPT